VRLEFQVEKHLNVDGSHLQRLCENLIPLLQQIAPQPLFEHPSLLRTGRYSLLRTAESVGETKWSSKRFSALVNGHSICPPHNLTSANRGEFLYFVKTILLQVT